MQTGSKNRVPRKVKKWHKKRGYQTQWSCWGKYYFTRDYGPFYVRNVKV